MPTNALLHPSEGLRKLTVHALIHLLVLLLSGFPGPISFVFAASTHNTMPILRHTPPSPLHTTGETIKIEAVVESEAKLVKVFLLYRTPGAASFQKIEMIPGNKGFFSTHLETSKKFEKGIEYYIVAVDAFGSKGFDGSNTKPYFVEVRAGVRNLSSGDNSGREASGRQKPFWKKRWFWIAVVAVAGGGIAAAGSGGGGGGVSSTGTIVVE